MVSLPRRAVMALSLLAISAVLVTVLGAAKPLPHTQTYEHVSFTPPALVGKHIPIMNPSRIRPNTCTQVYLGSWVMHPVNNDNIYITPTVYNCSGNYNVDSVTWSYGSGSGAQLTNWWFYTNCGDWFSAMSGSPYAYLDSSHTSYTAAIGKQVPNPNNFDVDSKFSNGALWTACM